MDYNGYGLNDGYSTEKNMFETDLKIYDYTKNLKNINKENIIVLGYNIGTGIATYVSSQRDVDGLILVSPYDKALNLYNDTLNIFYGLFEILVRYKFKSIEYANFR